MLSPYPLIWLKWATLVDTFVANEPKTDSKKIVVRTVAAVCVQTTISNTLCDMKLIRYKGK